MKIIPCSGYEQMSQLAANSVLAEMENNPRSLLCPASGNSGIGLYKNLALTRTDNSSHFRQLRIIMLDEWLGLASDDPNSGNSFLHKHIIQPLSVSQDRYYAFASNASDPQKECERMKTVIREQGPIDICILGLGKNGHLGFNEPSDELWPHCHVARLSKTSKEHSMISDMEIAPDFGLTLGMADILQSRKIILLLTGPSKQEVIQKLLSNGITTQLPASLLRLHSRVECYLDRASVAE